MHDSSVDTPLGLVAVALDDPKASLSGIVGKAGKQIRFLNNLGAQQNSEENFRYLRIWCRGPLFQVREKFVPSALVLLRERNQAIAKVKTTGESQPTAL
jgi:hypothetical protein